ncbi:MAG TPA: type IIL restriction-modification enzyme MmeI [Bacillota bacterium]|nr:type IIL restriction-modification enzyme MmeI [Bacillota bacterium]
MYTLYYYTLLSSERREYIPIVFLEKDVIPTGGTRIIPTADLYYFGILTSNVHMAWMKAVPGRLELSIDIHKMSCIITSLGLKLLKKRKIG